MPGARDLAVSMRSASSGEGSGRRQEVICEAAALFAERGVARTSLADIGTRVGIQKASLYHFFRSKEDLAFEVLRDVVDRPYLGLQAIAADGDLTPPAKLVAAAAALGKLFGDEPNKMHVLVRENMQRILSVEHSRHVAERKAAYTALCQQILEEGDRSGHLRCADTRLAAFALIGSVNWMFAWFHPGGALTGEDVGRSIGEMFVGGLLAREG